MSATTNYRSMASSIREPISPQESTGTVQQSSMKSKIHSFFNWRKSTNSIRPDSRIANVSNDRLNQMSQPSLRPAPSQRSLSGKTIGPKLECDGKSLYTVAQKKDKILLDPPPFAQIVPQTLLRANLETPNSFTVRTPDRVGRDNFLEDSTDDIVEVKRSHKRSESGQSCCSTNQKSFCFIDGPYLLRYDNDCDGSALPEKILVLGRNSVVFASDAVPGRPWVLQVSHTNTSAKNGNPTLRPSWSRMTLRQAESKRLTRTMLLIFNDSEDMYTWLFAIRKEIENLGGLEYRPETRDDQSWRDDLNEKFGSNTPTPLISRSVTPQPSLKAPSRCPSPLPPRPFAIYNAAGNRPTSNSSSTSSRQTSTSLDRLRDSVTSAGCSSTTAASTIDMSLGSKSPPQSASSSTFPSIPALADRPTGGLLLRAYSEPVINGTHDSSHSQGGLGTSIIHRRKLSVGNLRISNPESIRDSKPLINVPSPITGSPNDNLQSPQSAAPRSPLSQEVSQEPDVELPSLQVVADPPNPPSLNVPSLQARPVYSLFPAKDAKPSISIPLITNSPPRSTTSGSSSRPGSRGTIKTTSKSVKSQPGHKSQNSRTVTLKLARHRYSTLLAVDDFDAPQRSPAVTDDMIMFNFGASKQEPPRSPLPPTRVPDLGDLGLDLDFLRTPYKPSKRSSPLREQSKLTSKSMNNLNIDVTGVPAPVPADAPAGPPPAGPLPAVPADSRRSSRTTRSSQYSQYSQHSQSSRYSRASSATRYSQASQTGSDKHASTVPIPAPPKYTLSTQPDAVHVAASSGGPNHHKRNISNSTEGPPPPARASSVTSCRNTHRSVTSRSVKP